MTPSEHSRSTRGSRRRRSRRATLVGASAVAAALVGGTVVALAASAGAATVGAVYSTTSDWGSGYSGQYDVSNATSSTVNGWSLTFDLPSGAKISSLWNASYTASGQKITVTPAAWDSTLTTDQHAVVGFVVQGTGAPTGCTINGADCSTGTAPTPSGQPSTPPPTSPTPTARPTPTSTPTPTGAPTSPTPTAAPTTGTGSGTSADAAFSPYVDTSLWPPYDTAAAAKAGAAKDDNLAFITAGSGCTPEWGGVSTLADTPDPGQMNELRAAGGDVRVSFGGANGTELAESCTSVSSLAAAYQQVITAYRLTKIDFDVEGAAASDTAGITRRDQAIAQLQAAAKTQGRTLDVSFTLPVLPSGLVQSGTDLLQDAKANGVDISAVNIMAMDYGDSAAPDPSGQMGTYAIDAATATEAQIKSIFGWTDAQAWAHVAVTPMIGVNDTSDEVFTVADATQLAAFATGKHLAWLSMWSAARDQECSGGAQSYASPSCSSIVQTQYAFAKALGAYTG
ncbi:sugar hydrolase [Streptacidiphilus sp. PB12-B1b]|uniref:cellulose binding domain-containing protein n=1 Tax=Streptacidiphilus sp. PB12-B1b TaxID=2705012 RepID=UPI0015FA0B1F|nr:cellulose binding domain-containing protein [Streptacidiphilus sp. PB12-B1b]QMU75355.1 sugar hydrolase [Streptacidiphilus sp. PB12-B1b]